MKYLSYFFSLLLLAVLVVAPGVAIAEQSSVTSAGPYGGPEPVPIQMLQVGERVFIDASAIDGGVEGTKGDAPAARPAKSKYQVQARGAAQRAERWRRGLSHI